MFSLARLKHPSQALLELVKRSHVCHKVVSAPLSTQRFTRKPIETQAEAGHKEQLHKFDEKQIDFGLLDPDKFGDLALHYKDATSATFYKRPLKSEDTKDDADGYDKLEIKRGVKKSPDAYMRILNELRHQKPPDVAQMLNMHREFVYEDRYIPDKFFYSVLIDACAEVGYTKKAVELFDEMARFDVMPTKHTITSLLNACANCTHTNEYGLEQVAKLRTKMQLSGYELNDIQYNSMIKAFARLGDMTTAYSVMQEMTAKKRPISSDTYSMLFMGCITDQQKGLLDATKMMSKFIADKRLNLYVFNLFLRCVRDCQLDSESLQQICEASASAAFLRIEPKKKLTEGHVESQLLDPTDSTNTSLSTDVMPNLLTGSNLDRIVAIDHTSLDRASNRFLLFGGLSGFTKLLDDHKIIPNLKTLTLFIDLMLPQDSLAQVKQLLQKYNLKADVFLYNVLIKKLAKTKNYSQCQEIIRQMQIEQVHPDIMTFGALTFSCLKVQHAKRLMKEMHQCNVLPNVEIAGSLLNIASRRVDLDYVSFMLEYMEKERLKLPTINIERIDLMLRNINREIATNERQNKPVDPAYKQSYEQLANQFRTIIEHSPIQPKVHPWSQFESSTIENKKAQYNEFVKLMKQKTDIKMRRQPYKPRVADYNDQVDK